jgi:hypothetical protein
MKEDNSVRKLRMGMKRLRKCKKDKKEKERQRQTTV